MKMIYFKLKSENGQVLAEYVVATSILALAAVGAYQLLPWIEINSKHDESIEAKLKIELPNLVEKL